MQAIIVLVVLFISNLVGRWALRSMGVIMIDSLAGLIIKPTVWGFFILAFGLGVILLLFKGLFYILGVVLMGLLYLSPVIIIIMLIVMLIRAKRR